MWFTLKQLLPDSTDFTEAIFKMPQISKHFSAMLKQILRNGKNLSSWFLKVFISANKKIIKNLDACAL